MNPNLLARLRSRKTPSTVLFAALFFAASFAANVTRGEPGDMPFDSATSFAAAAVVNLFFSYLLVSYLLWLGSKLEQKEVP